MNIRTGLVVKTLLCLSILVLINSSPTIAQEGSEWKTSIIGGDASAQIACSRDRYGWLHTVYIQNGAIYHSSGSLNSGWLGEEISKDIDPAKGVKVNFNENGGVEVFFMN